MSSTASLWPSFGPIPNLKTPKIILQEQADHLVAISNHLINAEIVTTPHSTSLNKISHIMKITASLVENYTAVIVMIDHEAIKVYPVTVTSRIKAMPVAIQAANEEEYIMLLQKVFEERETIETIQSLLSQSKAIEAYARQNKTVGR